MRHFLSLITYRVFSYRVNATVIGSKRGGKRGKDPKAKKPEEDLEELEPDEPDEIDHELYYINHDFYDFPGKRDLLNLIG